MNQPWHVIQKLEADNSRLAKEAIVAEAAKNNLKEFFLGAKLALDCLVSFGVKQVPEKESADGVGLSWDEFSTLANKLISRELTGHAARDAIIAASEQATTEQWNNWYRRILIKDLRCGTSEKTINKVVKKNYKEYEIPVFTCQLAHDSKEHSGKVKGKKLISDKLDGVRLLTFVYPDGRVDQYSRNGKELHNFEHVKRQFSMIASKLPEPMVFDGEIMSSSFQTLMKQVHRKENVDATDAVLYLFDWLPVSAFTNGIHKKPQQQRSDELEQWFTNNGAFASIAANIRTLPQELVDLDSKEGRARFNEINQAAIDAGREGIMIKDPNAYYELKRSVAWLKLKPVITVDLEVINVEEGTGKNTGKMGALACHGVENGKHISVSVGGGYTDQMRAEIWADIKQRPVEWTTVVDGKANINVAMPTDRIIIGQIVEVEADAITQNQDGTYSLRFPRFVRFRGFDQGEKL